jgi:hypothetical protein
MADKEIKIEFAPGCFDSFDGTQEELEGLMEEIRRLVSSGELFEKSVPLDLDELSEEDFDIIEHIQKTENPRNLH